MKKLLTIFFALSLIMAYTMPAMAIDDIEDNQAAAALLGQTNQAQKGGEIDNDGLDIDTEDIIVPVNNDNNRIGNDNSTNDSNNTDDSVNVDVKTGDLLSNNTDKSDDDMIDQDGDQDLLDNKNGTIEVSDIANDKSQDNDDNSTDNSTNDSWNDNSQDNDDESINVDVAFDDVVDMEGAEAAAAMGGFAIAVDIDDIELDFATTTSNAAITQTSNFNNNPSATNDGKKDGDSKAEGFFSECHSVDADVYDNIGVMGATFSAGHFNNQANLNNVNVTVQY